MVSLSAITHTVVLISAMPNTLILGNFDLEVILIQKKIY